MHSYNFRYCILKKMKRYRVGSVLKAPPFFLSIELSARLSANMITTMWTKIKWHDWASPVTTPKNLKGVKKKLFFRKERMFNNFLWHFNCFLIRHFFLPKSELYKFLLFLSRNKHTKFKLKTHHRQNILFFALLPSLFPFFFFFVFFLSFLLPSFFISFLL